MDRVAHELNPARVLAAAVPAAVVLLLGELTDRFAAQLLEGTADVTHVEEELLIKWLKRQGHDDKIIGKVLRELDRAKALGGSKSPWTFP